MAPGEHPNKIPLTTRRRSSRSIRPEQALAGIPRRIHRVSFDPRHQAAQGPVSSGGGGSDLLVLSALFPCVLFAQRSVIPPLSASSTRRMPQAQTKAPGRRAAQAGNLVDQCWTTAGPLWTMLGHVRNSRWPWLSTLDNFRARFRLFGDFPDHVGRGWDNH